MAGGFRGLLDLVGPSVGAGTPSVARPAIIGGVRASGTIPSLVSGPERRGDISRKSGEANVQDLAFGWGEPRDGARVGKQNAVWAFVNVAGGAGTYNVLHALGSKPVGVELFTVRYPAAAGTVPHVTAQAVRPEEWTATVARVNIVVPVGALAGCTAIFVVKGA